MGQRVTSTSVDEWTLDVVIGVCALMILLNWGALLSYLYATAKGRRKGGFSFAPPFLCGLVACGAILIHPRPGMPRLSWVPLALDPSIGFVVVVAALQRLFPRLRRLS